MNAGGVDKACKSNEIFRADSLDYINAKGTGEKVADEVGIYRNFPQGQE